MSVTSPPALTTTFTPPTDCTTDTWYIEYVKGTYYYTTSISNSLEGWYLSLGPTNWSTCFPSDYDPSTSFYYSPGVCPSGYDIATSEVISIGASSETRATCCPSSFTAQTGDDLVWYSTNRCFSVKTNTDYVWTMTKEGTITSKTTSGGLNAKAVFIRWQSTDFQTTTEATTTTDSADSTATDSMATTGSTRLSSGPSATATSAAADQSSDSSGGGSKAWIAGPVIGAVVACALIALLATWYNRRRWRQQNSAGPRQHLAELYEEHKVSEAPAGALYELPSSNY